MVFLPIILLILGIAFGVSAYRQGDKLKLAMAVSFILAAMGTAVITLFALSALN